MNDHLHRPLRSLLYTTFLTVAVLLVLLLSIGGCGQTKVEPTTIATRVDDIPHLIQTTKAASGISEGVLHPNQRAYFMGYDYISVIDGLARAQNILIPKLDPPYGPNLRHIGVAPASGLVYVLDIDGSGAIHIISDTYVITSLVGISKASFAIVTDEDTGEVYVFYSAQTASTPQSHVADSTATQLITDIVLPAFAQAARYNPVDGRIYVASYEITSDAATVNSLIVLDDHQIITTIRPLDDPHLAVADLTIDPQTGDVYVLLVSKVVYWDRVHPPRSLDLVAAGYKNFECLTVDPKRGWAYICAWTGRPSYVLVVDQDKLVAALPVAHWPYAIAADAKHDYVYVAHYDPTNLSVIRGTDLITTLNIVGYGSSSVVVDEAHDYVYVANADDGSVSVFGFDEEANEPSFWQTFLPWARR